MDATYLASQCPRCGRALSADAPAGLCAACLLEAGAESLTHGSDEQPTVLSPLSASSAAASDEIQLAAGQTFGPYRIGRLLGRGGMGEVYEAEHADTGRRLALKVLRARLGDREDRARFLREGQLAASVSHPHTVYIFGSEEIAGMPVISMELLPGGTLKDRVAASGPMPVADAVAAVLDIVGGLDAAQAAGILHRDIKPSNCFMDADGAVKVGDFGLSISTLARDVQQAGAPQGFQGTPQFAPPEQLRGQPLDVRADIYAVGATLFYLLTGEPVFEGRDLQELAARVLNDPPRSPRAIRPSMPAPLASVVLQCLAKDPASRPASYAVLADLLRPHATTTALPARLGLRTMAGIVDALITTLPFSLAAATVIEPKVTGTGFRTRPEQAWAAVIGFLYFLVLEGRWSASLGKRLFHLRVVSLAGSVSWRQIATRTALYYAPALPVSIVEIVVGTPALTEYMKTHLVFATGLSLMPIVGTALLFVTMRRSNGFAAVQDLASGTRVVMRPASVLRRRADEAAAAPVMPAPPARARCGPFDVVSEAREIAGGLLLVGFDSVLRRRVWIRALPAGSPPVTGVRRDIGRVGRLHWLAGRRSATENWDAFEAPDGQALADILAVSPPSWPTVKAWVLDLSTELEAAEREGSLPRLGLGCVWIRDDGRAVLLDFAAPQKPSPASRARPADANDLTPTALLAAVGDLARAKTDGPPQIPLSAAALIDSWTRGPGETAASARARLAAVAASPDRVDRFRRAIPITMLAIPIVMVLVALTAIVPQFKAAMSVEMIQMYRLLGELDPNRAGAPVDAAHRQAAEIYLAGHFRRELTDRQLWGSLMLQSERRLQTIAARVAAEHPAVSDAELAEARRVVEPDLTRIEDQYASTYGPQVPWSILVTAAALFGITGGFSLVVNLVSAAVVPGGVLTRLLGLAVVDRRGVEIGRLRSIARVLIVWSPLIAWAVFLGTAPVKTLTAGLAPLALGNVALVLLAAGGAWSIVARSRGPHDRLAGTWVVVR